MAGPAALDVRLGRREVLGAADEVAFRPLEADAKDETPVDDETDAETEEVLEMTVELAALELAAASSSWRITTEGRQYSAILREYQLSNAPLLQRHQTVEPPIANVPFSHFEKPPV